MSDSTCSSICSGSNSVCARDSEQDDRPVSARNLVRTPLSDELEARVHARVRAEWEKRERHGLTEADVDDNVRRRRRRRGLVLLLILLSFATLCVGSQPSHGWLLVWHARTPTPSHARPPAHTRLPCTHARIGKADHPCIVTHFHTYFHARTHRQA